MKLKVYSCPHPPCSKKYSSAVNLKRHVDCIHLRVKDFTCPVCSKRLSSKQNYREHVCIHTGERPFVCARCGVCFRQGSLYSQHKKTHRSKRKRVETLPVRLTFLMTFCPDRFFNPQVPIPTKPPLKFKETPALPEVRSAEKQRTNLLKDDQKAIF